jgi:hypothetical protein
MKISIPEGNIQCSLRPSNLKARTDGIIIFEIRERIKENKWGERASGG